MTNIRSTRCCHLPQVILPSNACLPISTSSFRIRKFGVIWRIQVYGFCTYSYYCASWLTGIKDSPPDYFCFSLFPIESNSTDKNTTTAKKGIQFGWVRRGDGIRVRKDAERILEHDLVPSYCSYWLWFVKRFPWCLLLCSSWCVETSCLVLSWGIFRC